MSATATRPASNDLDARRLGIAMGVLIVAVAILVVATVSRQLTLQSPSVPAEVPAAVANDRGWLNTTSGEQNLTISGTNGGGLIYVGIPYPKPPAVKVLNPGEIMATNLAPVAGSQPGPREHLAR